MNTINTYKHDHTYNINQSEFSNLDKQQFTNRNNYFLKIP